MQTERPTLETERLVLRPFRRADGPRIRELAGEREIAANTLDMPYPYEEGMAEEWIATHEDDLSKGKMVTFAVTIRNSDELIGAISISIDKQNSTGELGFWIGKPYWGGGYCTEAAAAVLRYGFEIWALNKVFARHFAGNPASGRVLEKIGMKYEGCLRRHIRKWEHFEDVCHYGILRCEFNNLPPA